MSCNDSGMTAVAQDKKGVSAVYPPDGQARLTEIYESDLKHLDPKGWLNDAVIDLYIR